MGADGSRAARELLFIVGAWLDGLMHTICFFNHKGGVGKTTMLFNAAIEMGRLGQRVLMVDLDAQANLSAVSLPDEALEALYAPGQDGLTVAHGFAPLVGGAGDMEPPEAVEVRTGSVWLLPGDIRLSDFEGIMPGAFTEALAGQERGFRVTSAPYRMIQDLGEAVDADFAFVDLGPNVGPLNRAVLLGSDYLIVPMASDLFSIRALPSVGQSLVGWIQQWATAKSLAPSLPFALPEGTPRVLGNLKNFHSLVPHAQTLRRAIFELEADDVIRGGQLTRARQSEEQFRELCENILARTG